MFCVLATWRSHLLKKGLLSNSLKTISVQNSKSYVCLQKSMRKTEDHQSKGWAGFLTLPPSLVQEKHLQRPMPFPSMKTMTASNRAEASSEPLFLLPCAKKVRKSMATAGLWHSCSLSTRDPHSSHVTYAPATYTATPRPSQLSTSIYKTCNRNI